MIASFEALYGSSPFQQKRYDRLLREYEALFGKRDVRFFSAPGRTEIGGNHTDHNRGKVLAAAIDLDIIAAAAKNGTNTIRLKSLEYSKIDVVNLDEPGKHETEFGRSASLIRGICERCRALGYQVGGFDAFTMSRVLKGSGLSSSAAFEVLVGTIISHLFNEDRISPIEIAKISQYAENVFYGKPSGLMDQTACSLGSFLEIDFEDPENPSVSQLHLDLKAEGYSLCIVDVGASHAGKSNEYAFIPSEMQQIAKMLGSETLRETSEEVFYTQISKLRESCGDRAVLRAIHFFEENRRVEAQAQALRANDLDRFFELVNASGDSSFMYLQNIYSPAETQFQGLSVALALSRKWLGTRGACRVHGGGFGGTMQAFVPNDFTEQYKEKIEAVFGKNACHILSIRPFGSVLLAR